VWGSRKLIDGINKLVLGFCKLSSIVLFERSKLIDQELERHTEKSCSDWSPRIHESIM
jgi:hypothetical protein